MFGPSVALEPPFGWSEASDTVAPPPINAGSGATLIAWRASRSASQGDVLVSACVSTPIPGWVEDLRPGVQARTSALTAATAERLVGVPIALREDRDHLVLRLAGAPEDGPRIGSARTFVGFTPDAVLTCFTICARAQAPEVLASLPPACDASVLGARLEGGTAPPGPGVLLGAVTWAVHNPTKTVTWAGVATLALGVLAVVSRRKPRSRI